MKEQNKKQKEGKNKRRKHHAWLNETEGSLALKKTGEIFGVK